MSYYATPHLHDFSPGRFPAIMWRGAHDYYGLPVYGELATKLGEHIGGPEVTADTRTFIPDPVRQKRYRAFLDRRIPRFAGPELYTRTCLYTLTPDHHFIVDRLPEHPQIAVFVGAGHAFKFASLLGQILATLTPSAEPEHDLADFRIDRPALWQPRTPIGRHGAYVDPAQVAGFR